MAFHCSHLEPLLASSIQRVQNAFAIDLRATFGDFVSASVQFVITAPVQPIGVRVRRLVRRSLASLLKCSR
jgi:hypothetical protein